MPGGTTSGFIYDWSIFDVDAMLPGLLNPSDSQRSTAAWQLVSETAENVTMYIFGDNLGVLPLIQFGFPDRANAALSQVSPWDYYATALYYYVWGTCFLIPFFASMHFSVVACISPRARRATDDSDDSIAITQ